MIIRGFLLVSILVQFGLAAHTQSRERHELTISECAAKGGECDESRGRPVCGTDDQTYPSRCHLLRVQCSGHQVSLKYRGPCKACKEAREYALKHKSKNPPKFVPRCKPDGTYAPIQCLGDTGCWCSDITGKPIENTSVRTGKPKCREFNKANIRRSPARHLSPSRRSCNKVDRVAFNSNLIQVFQSEYIRSGQHQRDIAAGKESPSVGSSSASFAPPIDKLVLDWKFAYLDTNANQMLDKTEFRELKKLVKRAVKPRRCGRAFGKFCDVDDDDRLSRNEWNNCLSKDGINRHQAAAHDSKGNSGNNTPNGYTNNNNNNNSNDRNNNNNNNNNRHVPSLYPTIHHQIHTNNHHNVIHNNDNNNNNNNRNINHHNTFDDFESESNAEDDESSQHLTEDYDDEADYDPEEVEDDDEDNSNVSKFIPSKNYPSIYYLRPKPESPLKESEGESDCLADQAAALEEQRHGNTLLYVPECTADGRYQRVQCYRSTPYCWCVHEDSGKNIPGTSVKNKRPQCDAIYSVTRPMKGCPEPKKTVFLKDLKEFLKTQLLSNANNSANTTKWNSEDERIATLSFVLLDKNKNKAWERKEWKIFRELMTNSKTLRKCGKKMPRYCDVNSDKKITLSEWLNCLQTQRIEVETTQNSTQTDESATSKPSKLVGSNPLEQYLKD